MGEIFILVFNFSQHAWLISLPNFDLVLEIERENFQILEGKNTWKTQVSLRCISLKYVNK